ncbi:MAG: hypothetical protein H6Q65_203 [Firmicutes bacterium]|nr:hypothetical protein [Bacillota bacterium]
MSIKNGTTLKSPVEMHRINLNAIPQALRQQSRWVWWDKDKKPYSVVTGKTIDPTNLSKGGTFAAAVEYIQKETRAKGLGFLLGDGISGVDIDEAFDETGCIKADATTIIAMLKPCYIERSPSGKGVHILGFGEKNTSACKKPLKDSKQLEVYDKERYFTVTGDRLPESERELTDLSSQIITLCDTYFAVPAYQETCIAATDDTWTDGEVIAAIQKSPTHAFIVNDLWNGDVSAYDGDQSRADAALVERLLFFSGGNEGQTDRLFRESGLMRDKWDEMRGRQTYGKVTIARIKRGMTVFHCWCRPLTEIGVAERMADQYGDRIKYCHDWGKRLLWDGRRWDIDKINRIQSMMVKTVRSIPNEVESINDDTQKAAYLKFSRGLEKNSAITNVLKQAERLMPVLSKDLDANLWRINCVNGTLDLTTGKLWTHDPTNLNTKIIPVAFDPTAKCLRYDAFLHTALCADEELIEFMDQYAGMSLTGSTREQCFVALYGSGNNGKSVELTIRRALMGDYVKTAPPNVFLEKRNGDGIPNDLADLQGTRLVVERDQGTSSFQ